MRIGTRGSALALAQARLVSGWLGGENEIVVVKVSGDVPPSGGSPGTDAGGGDKSRWVTELEQALLADEVDLAVHSAKDVPGELAEGLRLLGAPARATPADALIGAGSLEELPAGARVGTSSVRRCAQLLAERADLDVVSLRGNVDTRLRKLGEGQLDAIVLAGAGLARLGRDGEIGAVLDVERFVPAPGQGTLALQARSPDAATAAVVEPILDADATASLQAERAVAAALDADCDTPLGAHAVPAGCGCLNLRAWVGLPDGSAWLLDELLGGFYDPEELGRRVAERLMDVGAQQLLERSREMALERP
jgi:hydroxymethylbilane synthase